MSGECVDVLEVRATPYAVVQVVTAGPQGPAGPPGDTAFRKLTQAVAATVWTLTHELGYDPGGITVLDEDGYTLDDFGVQYLVPGETLRLSFDISVAGVAYLS